MLVPHTMARLHPLGGHWMLGCVLAHIQLIQLGFGGPWHRQADCRRAAHYGNIQRVDPSGDYLTFPVVGTWSGCRATHLLCMVGGVGRRSDQVGLASTRKASDVTLTCRPSDPRPQGSPQSAAAHHTGILGARSVHGCACIAAVCCGSAAPTLGGPLPKYSMVTYRSPILGPINHILQLQRLNRRPKPQPVPSCSCAHCTQHADGQPSQPAL